MPVSLRCFGHPSGLCPMNPSIQAVVWDFDGVLNRNVRDGRFIWQDGFEAFTGRSLDSFKAHMFGPDWQEVLAGQVSLRERVAAWCDAQGYAPGPEELIRFWFEADAHPDPQMLLVVHDLNRRGVRQVIATNNEPLRAAFIETQMGYGPRVERVFASGRMGVAKPDPRFFAHVAEALELEPASLLLIDDHASNVAAAAVAGWHAARFTDETRGNVLAGIGCAHL